MADLLGHEIKARIEQYLTDPLLQQISADPNVLKKIESEFPLKSTRLKLTLGDVYGDLNVFYKMLFDPSFALAAGSKTALVAVLIYFLNPFDYLPRGISFVGLVEDRLVIACAAQSCRDEIDRFTTSSQEESN